MALEGPLHLWNNWGIQILVLVSFALQVFLLVFAGFRRCSSSTLLRVALWLAYLLADSTAVYTLGHLSISSSSSREHQLVAFWAPFLLLHLGGQDTITAYALEDNSLWLRHLQVLVVQALGAAYVLYKYMAGTGTSLLLASISMFVAGLVKYGERIWALKRGAISNIRRSHYHPQQSNREHFERFVTGDRSEEEILLRAHCQFYICESVFTGRGIRHVLRKNGYETVSTGVDTYKLVEMELSLLYDILYTKAAIVHTWYGFCIHIVSLLGVATTFLLFQFMLRRDGYSYSRVDVIISYVLLVGAVVLEAISHLKALLSSWTRYLLCSGGWNRLFHAVTSLRRLVKPARRRLVPYSIGQYNLLHLTTRDKTKLESRLVGSSLGKKLGLCSWWNKHHFSGTFSPTNSLSTQDLKELVWQELPRVQQLDNIFNYKSRGRATLERMQAYKAHARWSVNIDIDQSILVWHIATDLYIQESEAHQYEPKLAEATSVLSNYMMFLLLRKPDMLPGGVSDLDTFLQILEVSCDNLLADRGNPVMASPRSRNLCHSRILQKVNLTEALLQKLKAWSKPKEAPRIESHKFAGLPESLALVKELLDLGRRDTLELIFGVWVEMMLYAAEYCTRDFHAKQLTSGGEFITIVWLLAYHQKYIEELKSQDQY